MIVDVRRIRTDLKMTQAQFANNFGFEISTLRHWEQGQRTPTGPARTLLLVIHRRPVEVMEAVKEINGRVAQVA